jgi:ribosomal protein S18 acetylase RimI-like enzyme
LVQAQYLVLDQGAPDDKALPVNEVKTIRVLHGRRNLTASFWAVARANLNKVKNLGRHPLLVGADFRHSFRALAILVIRLAMLMRIARPKDAPAIWSIIAPVIRAGETYTLDQDMSEEHALAYWMGPDKETFVAEEYGIILGTYYMRPNQGGGGRHICNCGFMVSADATGRGVARRMCEHSLAHARSHGYRGMQFNFVMSTNERAVSLWQKLEFEIVGRLPHAFHHPVQGHVDAFVMFQSL